MDHVFFLISCVNWVCKRQGTLQSNICIFSYKPCGVFFIIACLCVSLAFSFDSNWSCPCYQPPFLSEAAVCLWLSDLNYFFSWFFCIHFQWYVYVNQHTFSAGVSYIIREPSWSVASTDLGHWLINTAVCLFLVHIFYMDIIFLCLWIKQGQICIHRDLYHSY